jgi:hypothetical protein
MGVSEDLRGSQKPLRSHYERHCLSVIVKMAAERPQEAPVGLGIGRIFGEVGRHRRIDERTRPGANLVGRLLCISAAASLRRI